MYKVKLITDSTCDLSIDITNKYNIEVIPLLVHFKDETYEDGVDIKIDELFNRIETTGVFPITSQINPHRFTEIYSKYIKEGYKIVSIHLSSKMSGTYQSACLAKEMLNTEDIVVIDSLNVTSGLGLLVLRGAACIEKEMTIEEIENNIKKSILKVKSVLAFDSLEHLVKGGRLNRAAGMIGNALGIKLILEVRQGELAVIDKVRGTKKAIRKIIDYTMNENISKKDKPIILSIFSEEVRSAIKANFKSRSLEYIECQVGCVVGTHSGPGACGVFLLEE